MALLSLSLSLAHLACGEPEVRPPESTAPRSADELFGTSQVWDIELELSQAAIISLLDSPRVYVEGTLRIGDLELERVGVRLKGAYSFQSLNGKSSFKIKMNEFVPGQELVGLEKLTLNAMNQDRAQLHEWLGYQVFRANGVIASRAGFARVFVNGELYGLYADVESIDDEFLDENYGDGDGNLYEAPWTADLVPDKMEKYEQDEGDDTSRADLAQLVEVANRAGDEIFFGEARLLDTPEFLALVATEAAVGHWDGYWKPNNYFLYHEPTLDQWSFIPWGIDQTFDRTMPVFAGAGHLIEKCVGSAACVEEWAAVGMAVADEFERLDLPARVAEAEVLVEESIVEDERRPFPVELVERHRRMLGAFLDATPERLRRQFDCIEDGAEADRDGDGFGACTEDCDDTSGDARPGGTEVCDDLDNDCDGWVDELDECACGEETIGEARFLFCEHPARWSSASTRCAALGGTLAAPASAEESAALYAHAQTIAAGSWYLGVNDREEEQTWEVPYDGWAAGEPDDWGEEDCGVLAAFGDGAWADVNCGDGFPFVCRVGEDDDDGEGGGEGEGKGEGGTP